MAVRKAFSVAADDINIQPSAVALLDVLGFKNLERSSAAKAMRSARRMIVELTKWMNDENFNYIYGLGGKPNVTSSWFSDTICIVVQPAKEKLLQRDESKTMPSLLAVAATSVGYLVRQAAVAEVPLAFRGVIAVGEMAVVDENIYVGAPIAEASALYEKADGAFVWLSPAAYQIRMPHWPGVNTHRPLIEYEVPLKDGRTVHTKVVNPFIDMLPRAARHRCPERDRGDDGERPPRRHHQGTEYDRLPQGSGRHRATARAPRCSGA